MSQQIMPTRIKDKAVAAILGCCKSTVWAWTKSRPNFPQPRREGPHFTFWLRHEVEAYALHGENWREATANAE